MTSQSDSQAGYSLVEVLAAITILAIAIIPMVGMFDAGLGAASTSGNYDRARTLANLKLEQAKSLPYEGAGVDVKNDFPVASSTPDSSGYFDSSWRNPEPEIAGEFSGFQYRVQKQYLDQPPTCSASDPCGAVATFATRNSDDGLLRIAVSVKWGSSEQYTAIGVVAE